MTARTTAQRLPLRYHDKKKRTDKLTSPLQIWEHKDHPTTTAPASSPDATA